jgi:5'/3'-nucleotidase
MRILLTNDDGLKAPGIAAMHDAILDADKAVGSTLGEVFVAAPLTVQSATGHGATFHTPLMTRRVRVNDRMTGVAIDGRPADCVKLALTELWPQHFGADDHPDLVISGMNAGANYGINMIYSGTVAAALEAAILGVPAIAVSLHLGPHESDFTLAALRARKTIDRVLGSGLLRKHACISINIPRTPLGTNPESLPPIHVRPMNTHGMVDRYDRRASPAGDDYYWSTHAVESHTETQTDATPASDLHTGFEFHQIDEGSDVAALLAGAITVTPLAYDLTDHAALGEWRKALGQ